MINIIVNRCADYTSRCTYF